MQIPIWTVRSVIASLAVGAIVAAVLGGVLGTPWGLAALAGFPAGALALACSLLMRDPRLDAGALRPSRGTGSSLARLAIFMILASALVVDDALQLRGVSGFASSAVVLLTGFAAYLLGVIVWAQHHLAGDETSADPRLHGVTPGPDISQRT